VAGDRARIGSLVILLVALIGCSNSQDRPMPSFEETIRTIESRIIDLTWPGGLFRYEEFKEVHAHSPRYKEAALRSLAGEDLSEQQKLIVALAMQKLPYDDFLDFVDQVIDLYARGTISAKVLNWCVLPTYDWNTRLVEHYREAEANRRLRRLTELDGLDEQFRSYVEKEVLTGRARATVEQLRETGQIA
jgi:hypothetical protein